MANLTYRPEGLALLEQGGSAQEVLDALVAADPDRAHRQAGVVDRQGRAATFTGEHCHGWAGGRTGDGWAAQGNILTGPEVVDALADAYEGTSGPLPVRLATALLAADRAGGDSRGRQSAALLVVTPGGGYGGFSDVLVDLRVDDHEDPVPELVRLLDLHTLYFGKPDPDELLPLSGALEQEVHRAAGTPRARLPRGLGRGRELRGAARARGDRPAAARAAARGVLAARSLSWPGGARRAGAVRAGADGPGGVCAAAAAARSALAFVAYWSTYSWPESSISSYISSSVIERSTKRSSSMPE